MITNDIVCTILQAYDLHVIIDYVVQLNNSYLTLWSRLTGSAQNISACVFFPPWNVGCWVMHCTTFDDPWNFGHSIGASCLSSLLRLISFSISVEFCGSLYWWAVLSDFSICHLSLELCFFWLKQSVEQRILCRLVDDSFPFEAETWTFINSLV